MPCWRLRPSYFRIISFPKPKEARSKRSSIRSATGTPPEPVNRDANWTQRLDAAAPKRGRHRLFVAPPSRRHLYLPAPLSAGSATRSSWPTVVPVPILRVLCEGWVAHFLGRG